MFTANRMRHQLNKYSRNFVKYTIKRINSVIKSSAKHGMDCYCTYIELPVLSNHDKDKIAIALMNYYMGRNFKATAHCCRKGISVDIKW